MRKSERSQKVCGQRIESEGHEEALAVLHHLLPIGVALLEQRGEVVAGVGVGGRDQRVDVVPVLRPHVAQQVGGDGAGGGHGIAVLFAQARADVGVQREVERPDLFPEAVEFLGEIVGRHVVLGAPHGAVVLEAELARALVGEFDVADEILADGSGDGVPAGPGILQLLGVAALGQDLAELFEILAALRDRWGSTCLCRKCLPCR